MVIFHVYKRKAERAENQQVFLNTSENELTGYTTAPQGGAMEAGSRGHGRGGNQVSCEAALQLQGSHVA